MSFAYILILAVLVYIAYQLYQLNNSKKEEKEDQKLREMFPNLYSDTNEGRKEELRDFVRKNEGDELSNYIYLARFKLMNEAIQNEKNISQREKMEKAKESVTSELKDWQNRLDKAAERKEISRWEISYVLWTYLKEVNERFPNLYSNMNDCLIHCGFHTPASFKA